MEDHRTPVESTVKTLVFLLGLPGIAAALIRVFWTGGAGMDDILLLFSNVMLSMAAACVGCLFILAGRRRWWAHLLNSRWPMRRVFTWRIEQRPVPDPLGRSFALLAYNNGPARVFLSDIRKVQVFRPGIPVVLDMGVHVEAGVVVMPGHEAEVLSVVFMSQEQAESRAYIKITAIAQAERRGSPIERELDVIALRLYEGP